MVPVRLHFCNFCSLGMLACDFQSTEEHGDSPARCGLEDSEERAGPSPAGGVCPPRASPHRQGLLRAAPKLGLCRQPPSKCTGLSQTPLRCPLSAPDKLDTWKKLFGARDEPQQRANPSPGRALGEAQCEGHRAGRRGNVSPSGSWPSSCPARAVLDDGKEELFAQVLQERRGRCARGICCICTVFSLGTAEHKTPGQAAARETNRF